MKIFDLLEDIKMLQVNLIMIYIVHKISVSLKITQINLKIIFLSAFSKIIIDFYLKKIINFFHNI